MSQPQLKLENNQGIVAIITLLAVATLALAIVSTTSILAVDELKMVNAGSVVDKTFYAAESGLNEGLYLLGNGVVPNEDVIYDFEVDGIDVAVKITGNGYGRTVHSEATDSGGRKRILEIGATVSSFSGGFTYAIQGGSGGIQMDNNSRIIGDVYSDSSIFTTNPGNSGTEITGSVSLAGGGTISSNIEVGGTINLNAPVQPPLFTQANIGQWVSEITTVLASNCAPAGSYCVTTSQSLGGQRINGNLSIGNGRTLTLTGDLYVTGNINLSNNCAITINDVATGVNSGVRIISDGIITLKNNCTINSPNPSKFVFFISNYQTQIDDPGDKDYDPAIKIENNSAATVFITLNGTLEVSGSHNTELNAGVNKKVHLNQGATVEFKPQLSAFLFSQNGGGGEELETAFGSWQEL